MQANKPDHSSAELSDFLDKAKKASAVLKCLSHETRLMILCLLSESEKPVHEIEAFLGLPQASVSQQLARLRQDNLVSCRRDGRSIYYKIANRDVATIIGTLYDIYCSPAKAG